MRSSISFALILAVLSQPIHGLIPGKMWTCHNGADEQVCPGYGWGASMVDAWPSHVYGGHRYRSHVRGCCVPGDINNATAYATACEQYSGPYGVDYVGECAIPGCLDPC